MEAYCFGRDYHLPQLGWHCEGKTIDDMMGKAIRGHIECPTPDAVLNIETHLFNTTLTAESCECSLDLGRDVWLNKGRWSRLIKEYVSKTALDMFVSQAVEILSGDARDGATANMMFRDPDRYAKKHRWGGCLMGATFRGNRKKAGRPTITFYSRTTYIGYMGLLDSAIASVIAREICHAYNLHVGPKGAYIGLSEISFRWHISSQQLHCFKTLPYIYSQPDLMKQLEFLQSIGADRNIPPTWYHLVKWYDKVVTGWTKFLGRRKPSNELAEKWLLTEKYGPFRRVKRRWCEHKGFLTKHPPPSCPVSELDFNKSEETCLSGSQDEDTDELD